MRRPRKGVGGRPDAIRRLAVVGWLCLAPAAAAHDGPPYAILVDRPAGPVLLSVWADPDVGTGTFHVYLEPLAEGRALPEECSVEVFVQPVDARLIERGFAAEPLRLDPDRQHHLAEAEFDAVGDWTSRFAIDCAGRTGEAETVVEVTPPGQGPVFDFLLYLFPFAAIGALVVRALLVGRRGRRDGDEGTDDPDGGGGEKREGSGGSDEVIATEIR